MSAKSMFAKSAFGLGLTLVAALGGLAGVLDAEDAPLEEARKLYRRTEFQQALGLMAEARQDDPEVLLLTGQIHFMQNDYKRAIQSFEKAVAASPAASEPQRWLGKAYGRRAESGNPLLAPGLAGKARGSFEKAVALDPKNLSALNDLFEYYVEAPGFLGGGVDKAEALAAKIQPLDAAEHQYMLAQLALKRKNPAQAEAHFRKALELEPNDLGRLLDLAKFLARQGREPESEAIFARAAKVAPGSPKLWFERAKTYVRAKRNLPVAKELLQRYVAASLTIDDPPRAEAQRLLREAGQ